MAPRVVWLREVPPEVRAAAEPLIADSAGRAPAWCYRLVVCFDGGHETRAAEILAEPHRRRATLTLFAGWLGEDPESRARLVRHEFAHLLTWPLIDVCEAALADMEASKEPKLKALARRYREEWEHAVEAVTEDVRVALDGEAA